MLRVLEFRNIYLLPILAIALFYVVPAFLGIIIGENSYAFELFFLSISSVFIYFFSYKVFCGHWFTALYNSVLKIRIGLDFFSWFILAIYFLVIFYACLTAPDIALFAAIKGVSLTEISGLREEFLRTREGWERGLLYIYAICVSSLVPLVIAQMFVAKSKWRFYVLFAFLFSLALTLEKGRALVAMLPLIVIFVNLGNRKKAYMIAFFLVVLIAIVSLVARGGLASSENEGDANPLSGVPDEYNLFAGETSQFYYIVNRVWYIPYATAIDWLRYRVVKLNDESTVGKSISAVAWLTGEERVSLEQDVFTFQWGQNETGTGTANTVYYVDAFLTFGYFGVFLYSLLLAFCVRVCVCSRNKALIACLAISVYYVCFNSLSAVLFSGGLGFIFLLALFFRISDAK
ncbi:hypothetical protein [Pseudomonas sp. SG20052]|uniref:hypothetical protein n=1 Tax=Pseudomonas sp. SG20052 TaxID=3074147 RepID=UPI00287FDE05|nr:hypothetical protein [Pseudomonas sp. SG20052]WNF57344.1 hypothetical protein RHP74_08615 [Pseudomonas sp. SG20052]